ncbi:MAG: hypothetical protein Q9P01_22050 [Anaerolineae bacterium]|nr:hypothetical protein [Anaerolineae bacterium]MDQ7037422.1 hypothetical protein [Anaerolineae bacterium]
MPNRLWGLIIVIVLLITACAPVLELRNDAYFQDTSLVDGEPCFAPCWRNLTPGETTWDEAEATLPTFEDVSNIKRVRNRDTGEEIYNFHYGEGPQCCRIYTRDGSTLASLLLLVAPEMSLDAVIEQYGEPQYIQATDITDDQSFVTLVYVDVPMLLYIFAGGVTDGEISADSEVIGTVYMAPSEMTALLNETAMFTWNSYGVLNQLMSGEAVIPASANNEESSDSD